METAGVIEDILREIRSREGVDGNLQEARVSGGKGRRLVLVSSRGMG